MKKVLINNKWPILLPDHRADRPEWYINPYWEEKRLESMSQNITDKDFVYYIGAEEGDMAGLCQLWGAKVALFEPNDLVWPNIKAIWDANGFKEPFVTFSGFASDKDSQTDLNIHISTWPDSAEGELISNHGFKELFEPGDVAQIKIDTVVFDFKIPPPTAMSIDVEGSEWKVLEGARKTLETYKPKLWVSVHPEFMFRMFEQYQYDLRNWLKDMGYKETLLDYQHEIHLFYE